MFRCPKCHAELPADAKFCKGCGFNQTNARMMATQEQGGPAQAQPPRPMPPQQGQGVPGQPMRAATPPPQAPGNAPARPMPPQAGQGQGAQPMRSNTPTPPQTPGGPPQQQKANSLLSYSGIPNSPQAPRPQQPGMPPQQSPAQQPGMPPQQSPVQQPGMPPQSGWNNQGPAPIVRSSTPPNGGRPPASPQPVYQASPLSGPRESLWDGLSLDDLYNDPAMMATSQAAEHWRESWRMRQKAEAGPAVGIARGQAAVAEPLLAMQHSIARMRAVLNTNTKTPVDRSKGINFWIPLVLMSCIVLGLIAYTATTFKDTTTTTTHAAPVAIYPSIQVNKTSTTTYVAGSTISVIGKNFSHNSTVTFSLNSGTTDGQAQSADSDKKGVVATTLTVPATAQIGTYFLTAVDGPSKATTSLPVHVLPANLAATNPILNTSPLQSDVTQISFTASPDQPNPKPLDIHLKNPSNAAVVWSALTFSDYTQTDDKLPPIGVDGVSWLSLNSSFASGQIQSQGTGVLSIKASSMNLPPNPIIKTVASPYISYLVINTLDAQNQPGQMVFKVTLLVKPMGNEVIVTPAPTLVMLRTADGNCVDNSITLTNLGSTLINYSVQPVDGATGAAFTLGPNATGAQLLPVGSTNPDGTPSDVQAVKVSCHNVQAGDNLYAINVFPGTAKPIKLNVSIQPA